MLDKIRHTAEVAKFKTNQMLKVNKLQGEISQFKESIDKLRLQIADQVLALRASGQALPQVEELCTGIDDLNAKIAAKLAEIEAVKAEQPPAGPAAPAAPGTPPPATPV